MKLIKYLVIVILFTDLIYSHGQNKFGIKLTKIEMAYPFWSPNGKKTVFQCNLYGVWDIFIIDANGKTGHR